MDKSQITDYLKIPAHPNAEYAEVLQEQRIHLILNMIFIEPAKVSTQSPLQMVRLHTINSIFIPIPKKNDSGRGGSVAGDRRGVPRAGLLSR